MNRTTASTLELSSVPERICAWCVTSKVWVLRHAAQALVPFTRFMGLLINRVFCSALRFLSGSVSTKLKHYANVIELLLRFSSAKLLW